MKNYYAQFEQIGECIWRSTSSIPGKRVTILGGVHGNELTGIEVIKNMLKTFPKLISGQITLAIGNPKAVVNGTRGSEPHADLNRCFSKGILGKDLNFLSNYEEDRAHALASILQHSDLLIDIHSTNKPSKPFVRIGGDISEEHYQISSLLPCNTILIDPSYMLAGEVALTDEYVGSKGGIGICFESGIAGDVSSVSAIQKALLRILSEKLHLIEETSYVSSGKNVEVLDAMTVYEIIKVFKLSNNGFEWSPQLTVENFEFISKGLSIGYSRTGTELISPCDAYLLFPKVKSLWKIGHPLFWLAKKVKTNLKCNGRKV